MSGQTGGRTAPAEDPVAGGQVRGQPQLVHDLEPEEIADTPAAALAREGTAQQIRLRLCPLEKDEKRAAARTPWSTMTCRPDILAR